MSIPYSTASSSSNLSAAEWQEEQEQAQRSAPMAPSDHYEHSFHLRSRSSAHSQSPRRLSVFSGRSRSNTTTSTATSLTSNHQSPASSMTSLDTSSLRSREERSGSTAGLEKQESTAKSLFSRGSRIIKRQGSKFSISATLDEVEETEKEKQRFEVSELFSRKSRRSDAHEHLKRIISDPFDFHHLTHTSPSQFPTLDNASKNELVTEFSAIRASQKPVAELKGIRAQDIHFRNFSDVDLSSYRPGEPGEESRRVPPMSPPVSPGTSAPSSPVRQIPEVSARLVENFSRPASRHQKVPSYPSIIPPPRVSSRLAGSPELSEREPEAINGNISLASPSTYPEFADDEAHEPLSESDVGNAVTTPDESMDMSRSSYFTMHPSDLEDVPEEEEATFWREGSEHSSRSTSRSFIHHEVEPSAVEPSTVPQARADSSAYVEDELALRFSTALSSPTLPQGSTNSKESPTPQAEDLSRGVTSRKPTLGDAFLDSWDEDIDYCYEHAAESNCNFDWHRSSLDEAEDQEATLSPAPHEAITQSVKEGKGAVHSLFLDRFDLVTPDLDPTSAQSLMMAQEVVTPSTSGDALDYLGGKQNAHDDYFRPVGAQLLPSTLGKEMTQDTLYEEYLTADASSDRHFSFWSQRGSQYLEQAVSPRSSFSPISKCNSQESMILSRAASIVRKHRSSISTTNSVPELVPSMSSSREHISQESLGSVEPSGYAAAGPTAAPAHGASSPRHHRQTRSNVMDFGEMPRRPSVPAHDRGRSASAIDTESAAAAVSMMKGDGLPFAARMQSAALNKAIGQKRTRTSYSLFPTSGLASPRSRN